MKKDAFNLFMHLTLDKGNHKKHVLKRKLNIILTFLNSLNTEEKELFLKDDDYLKLITQKIFVDVDFFEILINERPLLNNLFNLDMDIQKKIFSYHLPNILAESDPDDIRKFDCRSKEYPILNPFLYNPFRIDDFENKELLREKIK